MTVWFDSQNNFSGFTLVAREGLPNGEAQPIRLGEDASFVTGFDIPKVLWSDPTTKIVGFRTTKQCAEAK